LLRAALSAGACVLLFPGEAKGQEQVTQNLLSFQYENDVFAGEDNGYTNGFKLAVTPGRSDAPDWLSGMAHLLTPFDAEGGLPWTWSLSQLMFTPESIVDPEFPPDDRPYAGWLNGAMSVFDLADGRLQRFRLAVGVVGPGSGAEQTQKQVHEMLGSDHPVGWDQQLGDEVTVQISYDRQWRVTLVENSVLWEVAPTAGVTVGNAVTGAELGAFMRVGDNIPVDFGPPRLDSLAGGSDYYEPTHGFGWFAYAGVGGQYVAHDIFVQGSLFEEGELLDHEPWRGQVYVGLSCYHGPTRITFTQVSESRAFDGQSRAGRFGAVAISWLL